MQKNKESQCLPPEIFILYELLNYESTDWVDIISLDEISPKSRTFTLSCKFIQNFGYKSNDRFTMYWIMSLPDDYPLSPPKFTIPTNYKKIYSPPNYSFCFEIAFAYFYQCFVIKKYETEHQKLRFSLIRSLHDLYLLFKKFNSLNTHFLSNIKSTHAIMSSINYDKSLLTHMFEKHKVYKFKQDVFDKRTQNLKIPIELYGIYADSVLLTKKELANDASQLSPFMNEFGGFHEVLLNPNLNYYLYGNKNSNDNLNNQKPSPEIDATSIHTQKDIQFNKYFIQDLPEEMRYIFYICDNTFYPIPEKSGKDYKNRSKKYKEKYKLKENAIIFSIPVLIAFSKPEYFSYVLKVINECKNHIQISTNDFPITQEEKHVIHILSTLLIKSMNLFVINRHKNNRILKKLVEMCCHYLKLYIHIKSQMFSSDKEKQLEMAINNNIEYINDIENYVCFLMIPSKNTNTNVINTCLNKFINKNINDCLCTEKFTSFLCQYLEMYSSQKNENGSFKEISPKMFESFLHWDLLISIVKDYNIFSSQDNDNDDEDDDSDGAFHESNIIIEDNDISRSEKIQIIKNKLNSIIFQLSTEDTKKILHIFNHYYIPTPEMGPLFDEKSDTPLEIDNSLHIILNTIYDKQKKEILEYIYNSNIKNESLILIYWICTKYPNHLKDLRDKRLIETIINKKPFGSFDNFRAFYEQKEKLFDYEKILHYYAEKNCN